MDEATVCVALWCWSFVPGCVAGTFWKDVFNSTLLDTCCMIQVSTEMHYRHRFLNVSDSFKCVSFFLKCGRSSRGLDAIPTDALFSQNYMD